MMARMSSFPSLLAFFLWSVITSGLVSHAFLYNGAEQILQEMREVVLNTKLVIAHPPEDGEVGSQFETHIQMVTTDVDKFSKVFNNSFICVQLDAMPYACWPVLTSRIRFADVPDGIHTVEARLYNQYGSFTIEESSSGLRSFRCGTNAQIAPPPPDQEAPVVDQSIPPPEPPQPITIDVPILMIETPAELDSHGPAVDVYVDVQTANQTLFKMVFGNQFVCLKLDTNPAACWPVQQVDQRPLFVGIEDGVHTLTAALSHPYNGETVQETKTRRRTFFVFGSETASQTEIQPQQHPGSTLGMPTNDSTKASASISETVQTSPKRFQSIKASPAIVLQLEVDGVARSLTVTKGDNSSAIAERFCLAHGMNDGDCLTAVEEVIHSSIPIVAHVVQ